MRNFIVLLLLSLISIKANATKGHVFWREVEMLFQEKSAGFESVSYSVSYKDHRKVYFDVISDSKSAVKTITSAMKHESVLQGCSIVLAQEEEKISSYKSQVEITCF